MVCDMGSELDDDKIKDAEYLVLLILGKSGGKISILHLQKVFFFLWKFHPEIRKLVDFVAHLKGPYSSDLENLIKNPYYLSRCWRYLPPGKTEAEKVKGGYLEITDNGWRIYARLEKGLKEKAKNDEGALALKTGVDLIVPLYTRLEWDELLLLLYTDETNKKYSIKSELSNKIIRNSHRIIDNLISKGVIPGEKRESLVKRVECARWLK